MKPLDPRLTRYARAARRYIATTAVTGVLIAGLVVAQAWLISRIVAPLMAGGAAGAGTASLVRALAAVVAARAAVVHFQESRAHRAATRTIIELRQRVVAHAAALGPRWQAVNAARTATVLTRGLDDLEPYFTRYLPQLILASTLTPLTALVMLLQDAPSTLAVALTIPLIPVFMILIGRLTRQHSAERLAAMERLGAQVLDLVAGLPTLKALGREIGPGTRIERLGRAYNRTTMATLRVAFLSGAVLEFITTLSVAIIAVEVGLRLLFGRMDPATGLLVIMIAPEVYQPLRRVGLHFHASANGVAAADAVFEILDAPPPERGDLPAPDLSRAAIRIEDLSVTARGARAPAGLSATIRPGRLVALAGPSGAGKTTASQVLLGLLAPDDGRVLVLPEEGGAVDLARIDPASWWEQVAWVPQRPAIAPGTLARAVAGPHRPAAPGDPVPPELEAAARATGFDEVVAALPEGWATRIGHGGAGLSVGQRQRLALTRALASPAPLVVLDEPTAHLDAAAEAHVLAGVAALREAGRTVVVIAHRRALLAVADDVIEVRSAPRPDGGRAEEDRGGDDQGGAVGAPAREPAGAGT